MTALVLDGKAVAASWEAERTRAPRNRAFAFVIAIAATFGAAANADPRDDAIDVAIAADRYPGDSAQDAWRKPRDVLRFLEIEPGHHTLDYFSGPGYYTELMSRVVGPGGSVIIYNNELYAQAAHHDLMRRLGRKRLPNVTQVKSAPNYLVLKPESLDRVLFMQVYHDLYWRPRESPDQMGDPQRVLTGLYRALKPGGLIVVVDHAAHPTPRQNLVQLASRLHRIDPKAVRQDFETAGFEFAGESDALRSDKDDYDRSVFDPSVRRRTDQFMYKFRKPNGLHQ